MRWQQGRETLDGMIERGELERVPASREMAQRTVDLHRHRWGSHFDPRMGRMRMQAVQAV